MGRFFLNINASSLFSGGNAPTLEILIGGIVVSSSSMLSGSSSYEFFLDYTGNFPSSLAFRFEGSSGDPGDSITFNSVQVNGQAVDNTYLTQVTINQGQSSNVNTISTDHLFGQVEPTIPNIGTVTETGTAGDDFMFGTMGDDVFDAQGGNDYIVGMDGDDGVDGGAGNDQIFTMDGNDIVVAGTGDDLVMGGAGDDLIYGQGDNDTLVGEAGNDTLNGGAGDDGLLGDAGDDVLFGEAGNDYLIGGAGDDALFGGTEADTLIGGADNDDLFGEAGNDSLFGDAGDDLLDGESGDDTLNGGAGDDTINGGIGSDEIFGGDGVDTIDGGDNDDNISGGDGADIIEGGDGADVILSGAGADTVNGGSGNDIVHGHGLDGDQISDILFNNPNVVYSQDTGSFYQFIADGSITWTAAQTAATTTTLNGVGGHLATVTSSTEVAFLDAQVNPTNNTSIGSYWTSGHDLVETGEWFFTDGNESGVQFWSGQDTGSAVSGFEDMWVAGQPNDVGQNYVYLLSYSDGLADSNDTPFAHGDGYIIEWEAGSFSDDNAVDTLNGNDGNDILYGYGGNDVLNGGDDNDQLYGGDDGDTLNGDAGDDVLSGGDGADTINGGDDNDTVYGGQGIDTVDGGSGDDLINGDAGNDILNGGEGIDTINGGNNNDTINGDDGDDILNGGDGIDTINGGLDDDTIDGGDGNDTIYGDTTGDVDVMEAGSTNVTQANSTQWHSVSFTGTIENAVVKMFAEDVGAEPFTIRVRDITSTGFEFQLDEYDYQDGSTGAENISWIAVASGIHTLDSGLTIEAGFTTAVNETTTSVNFNNSFTDAVVFSQVSSDNELSAVVTRNDNVTGSGFTVQMQEEEASSGAHVSEDIGWIAIESGGSVGDGIIAGTTGDTVTNGTTTVNFGGSFDSTPVFVGDMQILDGGDTAVTAGLSLSASQSQITIDEEQSDNTEISHTTEDVGYIVLESGVYTAQGDVNGSDVLNGGDGDDVLYADASEDLLVADGAASNQLYAAISNNNPHAYWTLGEGSGTTADNVGSVGSAIDGTIIGGPTMGTDPLYLGGGTSIDFDGMNDGILIPDSDFINLQTYPERTVELVFNADDILTRQVLWEEGGGTNGLTIYIDGGNVYVTGEDDGNWIDADIHGSISLGTTHHIAFVFDQPNNSFTGYLDGVDIGSVTVDNTVFPSHSGDIGIGYAPDGVQFHDGEDNSGGYHFDGQISDVALYNDALSAADILAHAEAIQGNTATAIAIDDVLSGGDGFDELYGGEGRDVFLFEAISAFNDVDEVHAFDLGEQDAIDISDLLTGYVDGVSDINDFVEATTSGGNTVISVDTNGAVGGASFVDVASIIDVTGMTIDGMMLNNSLIV